LSDVKFKHIDHDNPAFFGQNEKNQLDTFMIMDWDLVLGFHTRWKEETGLV
jgi:hypothetical protein